MPFSPDQLSDLARLKAADPERPTVVELFRFAAQIALVCIGRLFEIIAPVQRACPALARRWMRLHTLQLRLMLTLRFAPENFTPTQLRRLARAKHILEFFLNRPIPHLSPSPSQSASPSQLESESLPLDNSGNLQSSNCNLHWANPQSTTRVRTPGEFSRQQSEIPRSPRLVRYIPDQATLAAALKSSSLPPNCAAALLENPGDACVRMLVQLQKLYHTIFTPAPAPTTEGGRTSDPTSPSPSPSPVNLQSDAPYVHPVNVVNTVNTVHPVHSVHNVHPVHSSQSPHSAFHIPHSAAPP